MAPAIAAAFPRRSSVVSYAPPGFSPRFSAPSSLFSVPPAVASGSSFLAPGYSSAGSTFLFSLWVCSSRVGLCSGGFGGLVVASGFSAFFFHIFSISDPPLLSSLPSLATLGSTASASAHSPSGFQSTASGSTSGLMALFLSACSLVILNSACCSFRDLFCSSLSALGYPSDVTFAPSWRLLRLPWRWLLILRLGCLLPYLALFVLPLTSCASLLFELFSGLLGRRSLLLLLVHSLCGSFPLRRLLYSRSLSPGSSGFALPSLLLFSCIASLLAGNILGYSFASSLCQSSVAISALLGSATPVHHSLLARFVRPLLPFLFTLLHPALLVAVTSLRFFLCCWSACRACGSSSLRRLAVCRVCCRSSLV